MKEMCIVCGINFVKGQIQEDEGYLDWCESCIKEDIQLQIGLDSWYEEDCFERDL